MPNTDRQIDGLREHKKDKGRKIGKKKGNRPNWLINPNWSCLCRVMLFTLFFQSASSYNDVQESCSLTPSTSPLIGLLSQTQLMFHIMPNTQTITSGWVMVVIHMLLWLQFPACFVLNNYLSLETSPIPIMILVSLLIIFFSVANIQLDRPEKCKHSWNRDPCLH